MHSINRKRPSVRLYPNQEAELMRLPPEQRDQARANMIRIIHGKQDEAYDRKRLERSGLWDWSAKSKEKLVITRIVRGETPQV